MSHEAKHRERQEIEEEGGGDWATPESSKEVTPIRARFKRGNRTSPADNL